MVNYSLQFVRKVPKETCEIHPREVCFDIEKQYPKLKMHSECQYLPRETCTPERVRPKEINRPVIKKICTKSDDSNTDSYENTSEKVFKGCEDYAFIDGKTGIYQITTFVNDQKVSLWCEDDKTLIQRRRSTSNADTTYFEKSWDEYKNGFNNGKDNIWIGLDVAHLLTTYYDYTVLDITVNSERQETYQGFTIGPEENGYEVPYIGTNGASLRFSAGKVDNDNKVNEACVENHSGGWWYDQCGDWNLNGQLSQENGADLDPKLAFFDGQRVYSSSMTISRPVESRQ